MSAARVSSSESRSTISAIKLSVITQKSDEIAILCNLEVYMIMMFVWLKMRPEYVKSYVVI